MTTVSTRNLPLDEYPNLLPLRKPILFGGYVLTHASVIESEKGAIRIVAFSKILDMNKYDILPNDRKMEVTAVPQVVTFSEFKEIIQNELEIVFYVMKGRTLNLVK